MFSYFRRKEYFTRDERQRVVDAIQSAERKTSGEIRVFVESRCRFVNPLHRAEEIFWGLKMDHTRDHNGVLIYLAMKDHQYAIYADKAIHEKLGEEYWREEVSKMRHHFRSDHYSDAIVEVVADIGEALQRHFPYDKDSDKNELPDDMVFGN